MKRIELKILGISSGHTAASYTLILEEVGGSRKLPVVIGSAEAQSIAVQIEGIKPVRPMTHDLFKTTLSGFSVQIKEVIISKLEEGIFYSNLKADHPDLGEREFDARTSDAIAIALRFGCPIYTYESIMNEAGIILSESEAQELQGESEPDDTDFGEEESIQIDEVLESLDEDENELNALDLTDLEHMLDEAIKEENYDLAARIRDEINKRKNN